MAPRRILPVFILGILSAMGCESTASLGELDPQSTTNAVGDSGVGSSDGAPALDSSTECSNHGGTCEFYDGLADPDPCTALRRPFGQFACGGAPGTYLCCLPAPAPDNECAQNGGTCEYWDGLANTDPCTATLRPIGKFPCEGTADISYLCCLPK